MATRTKSFPRVSGEWRPKVYTEAASQSFKAGDFLYVASGGGGVAICAAAGANFSAGSGERFVGIALQNASGVTNAAISVVAPVDDSANVYLPVEYDGTPASAVTAIAQVGDSYCLRNISASEGWGINLNAASNPTFTIRSIAKDFPVGEQYGTVVAAPVATAVLYA